MYEVVNDELRIKACGLADLTAEQVSDFLKLWEDGAKIGTLTYSLRVKQGIWC